MASRSTIVDGYIKNYERAQAEVRNSHVELLGRPVESSPMQVLKLKNTYVSKVRKADEIEDE